MSIRTGLDNEKANGYHSFAGLLEEGASMLRFQRLSDLVVSAVVD